MRKIAVLSTLVVTAGASLLGVSPASAHTPDISASCAGVHVGATAYDAGLDNRWSVTIGGVTQSGTFGASFDQTFAVPQAGATTSWSAYVEAQDGSYHGEQSGTVGPCGAPADACADLAGNQPAGTPCLPPPDVSRGGAKSLDGCTVTFRGKSYGAGTLTYDEKYTDTYVFNASTNAWDLVKDTTPSVANVAFTPWTKSQQVRHHCVRKPAKPSAEQASHSSNHGNKAVPATSSPASAGPATSSTLVPTAVDAGVGGAASPVSAPAIAGAPAGGHEVPALLLVLGGVGLLSVAGRRTLRRR